MKRDCPVRNPRLAWRELAGEIVIISPDDSYVHELNETAAMVWKQADGETGPEEIALGIAAEYQVELDQARADVADLLAHLSDKQLILLNPPGEAQ